jgi:predicted O-methyltransferase YrrM
VSKLAKHWKLIRTVVANPKTLANILMDPYENEIRSRLKRVYGLGEGLSTIDLLDVVPGLNETLSPYCFMNGSSRTVDLAMLKALARRFSDCRYLEIGTLRGESIANIAQVAKECVSLSLSDQEMVQRGWPENYLINNGFFLGQVPNLKRIGHDSSTYDFSTLGKFDLVFVDGDHSYEGVVSDTKNAFRVLRDENSIIVWHDYGMEYEAPRWSVMAGILDAAPEHARAHIYHVSNTLCAIYIREDFKTSFTVYPSVPNKVFAVTISATELPADESETPRSRPPKSGV